MFITSLVPGVRLGCSCGAVASSSSTASFFVASRQSKRIILQNISCRNTLGSPRWRSTASDDEATKVSENSTAKAGHSIRSEQSPDSAMETSGDVQPEALDPSNARPSQRHHLGTIENERMAHDTTLQDDGLSSQKARLAPTLLRLCNEAIDLSRQSPDGTTYDDVRTLLQQAASVYLVLVHHSSARSDAEAGLSYETFLVRSGYAHVVRLISALTGAQGAEACARMMIDYLQWETELRQRGFELAIRSKSTYRDADYRDADGFYRERQAITREEYVLLFSPSLQDMTPILHDLFFDLTTRSARTVGQVWRKKARGFDPGAESYALVHRLWELIRQFPVGVWDRPFSAEWLRFRHPVSSTFATGSDVLNECCSMLLRACLASSRLDAAVQLLEDELDRWQATPQPHIRRMLSSISDSIRRRRRYVRESRALEMEESNEVTRTIYVHDLLRLVKLLQKTSSLSAARSPSSTVGVEGLDFDTILRCIFDADELVELRLVTDREDRSVLAQALSGGRRWLFECLQEATTGRLPATMRIATCNLLLDRLTRYSPLLGEASALLGLRLVSKMTERDDLPSPDDVTVNVLMSNATSSDQKLIRASFAAAYDLLLRKWTASGEGEAPAMISDATHTLSIDAPVSRAQFWALLSDAIQRQDSGRLVSMLRALLASLDRSEHRAISSIDTRTLVFALYPSLDIHRRRVRRERSAMQHQQEQQATTPEQAIHSPDMSAFAVTVGSVHNEVQAQRELRIEYRFDVLTLVLRYTARQLRTGLAERVFRLIMRVHVRQAMLFLEGAARRPSWQRRLAETRLSVRTYNVMMRVYAGEVRREALYRLDGDGGKRRRHRPLRLQHTASRSAAVESKRMVRGWLRVRTGPQAGAEVEPWLFANRATAARHMVMLRYAELRSLWEANGCFKADAATMADRRLMPRANFFRTIFDIFRRGGQRRAPLDVHLPVNRRFLAVVLDDMRTLGIPPPSSVAAQLMSGRSSP